MNQVSEKKTILHLICGLPGSGKTTLAKSIALENEAIRLCPDEWIIDIWGEKLETEGNSFRGQIEQLQWKMAKEFLRRGFDVIIEWGTWGKDEREKIKDDARVLGAKVHFYYLNLPREILKERITKRNQSDIKYEFIIRENEMDSFLDECINSMQVPTTEELEGYDYFTIIDN
jgi:predicted kinase